MNEPKQQLGYDAVLKALKAHSGAIPGVSDDELEAGFQAFQQETDRGAVILGATTLEDKLGDRLAEDMGHLNSDERARLFGYDGPLGTFSAKLRMAHALKHLDRQTFKIGEIVREMRNACAHSRQDISFKDEALRNAIIKIGEMADLDFSPKDDPPKLRFIYLTVIAWLVNYIYAEPDKPTFTGFLENVIAVFKARKRASEGKPLGQSSPTSP